MVNYILCYLPTSHSLSGPYHFIQEWEVHVVRSYEDGLVPHHDVSDEWQQLGELTIGECQCLYR